MKVSLKTTYGIMAALELALRKGLSPVQAKTIARRQSIPARFLEQILNALKQAGFVESFRGSQGGYFLTKHPEEISLAQLMEALDGSFMTGIHHHTHHKNGLAPQPNPTEMLLDSIWEQVRAAELTILRSLTLKDLVDRHQKLDQERALMYHI